MSRLTSYVRGAVLAAAWASVSAASGGCGDDGTGPIDPMGPWSRGPELPAARLEPGLAALDGELIVAGGFGPGLAIERSVLALDPVTATWSRGPDLPVAWTHLQLATVGATLYALGGLAGTQFVARGEAFALVDGAWQSRASMPVGEERGSAAVVIDPPHVMLLGGASTTDALASCWAYDTVADTWTALPPLPEPRSHPAATITADGTIVVAGGLRTLDSTQPMADVIALAPGASTWTARAPMPTARGGCAYATLDGVLLCAGGEAGALALDAVEAYDPIADAWTVRAALPEARAGTQAATLGDAVYLAGGAYALRYEPRATVVVYRE